MIRFLLNNKEINTALPSGMLLLDFIRYTQLLKGTKIGCREGDCGACTVLVGDIKEGKLIYSGMTSCLMALGNAAGKHIVTIEGLNTTGLNAIQQAFAEEGATQCGFCTPGFIVSLGGYCMSDVLPSKENAIDAINGNICRCTGYKSIERATERINDLLSQRGGVPTIQFAIENNIIPGYFSDAEKKLRELIAAIPLDTKHIGNKFLAGGTDLYVQQHETMPTEEISFLFGRSELKGIRQAETSCEIGAATTVSDIANSGVFKEFFPRLENYIRLVSSTQIRNMATVGGNFTNASPIGDLTIFFLALDAELTLANGLETRSVLLKTFYKGYKVLDKLPDEIITKISFTLPGEGQHFNFEKVSKRTCLDIASVNSAILLSTEGNTITNANLSAGGVGPIPLFLSKSSEWLAGKPVSAETIEQLLQIVQEEISPISDARGSATYKRLLLSQLIKAHFITMFPALSFQQLMKQPA